jgi:TolB protein
MKVLLVAGVCSMCAGACAAYDDIGDESLEVVKMPVVNGKLAYSRFNATGTGWNVYMVEPDGSGLTMLPPGSDYVHENDPAFSPGGRLIAFVRGNASDSTDNEIYRMNADGTCVRQLTNSPAQVSEPDWSPDGTRIAYVRRCHIVTMNSDGTGVFLTDANQCADPDQWRGTPRWSPDGSKILFVSSEVDGAGDVFTMNPDGSGVARLTTDSAGEGTADWSPDGTKIAFASLRDDTARGELYVMDADGGNVVRLTDHASAFDFMPSWSPDGQKIAFFSDFEAPGFGLNLYKMNTDGTGIRLVATDSAGSRIDWAPRFRGLSVSWSNAVQVATDCNSLSKDATAPATWNAGASSIETLAGDGALEFTTRENTSKKAAGLSAGDDAADLDDIDFAIYLRDDGAVLVSEGTSLRRRVGSYAAGDIFRVQVKAGVVTYWQNSVRLYRSQAIPSFPLLVDTSLRTPGATISDVTLEAN